MEQPPPYLLLASPGDDRPLGIINNIYVNPSSSSRSHLVPAADPLREMLSIFNIPPITVDEILRCIREVPEENWLGRLEYCGIQGDERAIVLDIMTSALTAGQ